MMRKYIVLLIFVSLAFTSCRKDNSIDSTEIRLNLQLSLMNDNFDTFQSLLLDENSITEEEFAILKDRVGSNNSNSVREFQFMNFDNGEMLLLELVRDIDGSQYKIQDIIFIPEELKDFFNNDLR